MVIISPDRYILYYLTKPIPNEYMYSFRNIKKYHVSFHQSRFEQEIFHNIQNSRRLCKLCSPSEIEDDFHFILICPFYEKKKDFIFKNKTYLPINLFNCCQQLLSESNHVFGGKKLLQVKKILRYKKIFVGDPLYYHVFLQLLFLIYFIITSFKWFLKNIFLISILRSCVIKSII